MVHPLVEQLRFARSEFQRGLTGVTAQEAQRRVLPMNCISWNVGHLAWQEQRYWLSFAQGNVPMPELNDEFAFGAPSSTPAFDDVLRTWHAITADADSWLDGITTETLTSKAKAAIGGKPSEYTFGSLLKRVICHYWYHTGENAAIRQQLGHSGLPDFVGDIDGEARFDPNPAAADGPRSCTQGPRRSASAPSRPLATEHRPMGLRRAGSAEPASA